MKNQTFRLFSIVAYDESDTLQFNDILNTIIKNDLKYFFVRHQKEKEELKEHYHIMIYFEVATTIKKVSDILNISENNIKVKDDFGNRYTLKKSIGYFIHYNNNDKINYKYEDIKTNCTDLIKKYYDILTGGNSEKNELQEILLFIQNNRPHTQEVLQFCIDNDLLKTFKKYSYIIHNITIYNR